MIIDSGWDFVQLSVTRMNWEKPDARRLLAITMDRDLSYWGTEVIDEHFDGDLRAVAEKVIDTVDRDFIRYFATVEQVAELDRNYAWAGSGPDDLITAELTRIGESRGMHHIGHYQLDPNEWHGTGPMHGFRNYPLAVLPKYEITHPPQYSGLRRATRSDHRFGFADEFDGIEGIAERRRPGELDVTRTND